MDVIQIKRPRLWVGIDRAKLSEGQARSFLSDSNAGAVCVFAGTTRQMTGSQETSTLEYDCYPEMAAAEMERLGDAAFNEWSLKKVVLHHRIGEVPIGDASVLIGVSSAHRHDAFSACRFLIDSLKESVPIWKKEIYADGTTEWVGIPEDTSLQSTASGKLT